MGHTPKTTANGFLERAIEVVSPQWAADRAAQRLRNDILKRAYDAGSLSNRQFEHWTSARDGSANTETYGSLPWLRNRTRDLVRNNPYAKKAVQVLKTNCIGSGIRPSIPKNILSKPQEAKLMNAWRDWAETTSCDYNGRNNFYALQNMAWGAVVESGEVIIRKYIRYKKGVAIPLKLQVLEADYLDYSKDGYAMPDGGYIMQGVEFNSEGIRVAYWLFDKHPADMFPIPDNFMSKRVPAESVIHLFEELRPGQVRGVPQGVAAVTRLKNLDDYEEAQLVRQKIAACFSVFIRKNSRDFLEQYTTQTEGEQYDPLSEKMMPGIIDYLNPGEDVTFADPPEVRNYDEYTRTLIRSIAIAYGVTYESISGDLSNVSFSSGRMGWIEMHRQTQQWQDLLIVPGFCQEVWSWFMDIAVIAGVMPETKRVRAGWTPPRREMIDPIKETKGLNDQVRAGFTSRGEVIRSLGSDPDTVTNELIAERKAADGAGIMLESDPAWDAGRTNFGLAAAKEMKSTTKNKT